MIFISYAHADRRWKDRLVKQLQVPSDDGVSRLSVWDDSQSAVGNDWVTDVMRAIEASHAAVILISADFLTSPFVLQQEIPALLRLRESRGLRILPLIVHDCAWRQVSWLSPTQARPLDGKPLATMSKPKAESALAAFALEVLSLDPSRPRTPSAVHASTQTSARTSVPVPAPTTPPPSASREQAVVARAEAEFDAFTRQHQPSSEMERLLQDVVTDTYAPLTAFYRSLDILLEHDVMHQVQGMLSIETALRRQHHLPLTDERVAALRALLGTVIRERWDSVVSQASLNAERHVIHAVGYYMDYKQQEIRKLVEDQRRTTDYRGALAELDRLLKKALADSVLG